VFARQNSKPMNLPVAQNCLGINGTSKNSRYYESPKMLFMIHTNDCVRLSFAFLSNKIGASKARASRIRCILFVFGGCLESDQITTERMYVHYSAIFVNNRH
jgi:hypothetical protein